MISARVKNKGAFALFWKTLSPWGKRCAAIIPIFVLLGILTPYATSMIGTPPYAHKSVESRVILVEQRIDLQERIALQREILKLEDDARRRKLSESEKHYLEDLKQRLRELEKRK